MALEVNVAYSADGMFICTTCPKSGTPTIVKIKNPRSSEPDDMANWLCPDCFNDLLQKLLIIKLEGDINETYYPPHV